MFNVQSVEMQQEQMMAGHIYTPSTDTRTHVIDGCAQHEQLGGQYVAEQFVSCDI